MQLQLRLEESEAWLSLAGVSIDDFLGEGIKCKGQNGDEGADETNMAVTASVLSTQLVVGIVARWWNVRHTVLHEVQGA